jgi:hypothetical protein
MRLLLQGPSNLASGSWGGTDAILVQHSHYVVVGACVQHKLGARGRRESRLHPRSRQQQQQRVRRACQANSRVVKPRCCCCCCVYVHAAQLSADLLQGCTRTHRACPTPGVDVPFLKALICYTLSTCPTQEWGSTGLVSMMHCS